MALLSTRPNLQQVTTAVFGDANAGRNLVDSFASASADRYDVSYVGDKDRLSNYGMYGNPEASASETTMDWDYDNTGTVISTITCNKSRWIINPDSSYEHWNVAVYDPSNTYQITNGIFTAGCILRVSPKSQNLGEDYIFGTIYIGDGTYNWVGATIELSHAYYQSTTPPIVYIQCIDGTMTLSDTYYTLDIGSTSLYMGFTITNIDPNPSIVYITVYRDSTYKGGGELPRAGNGARTKTITLNENAIAGAAYNVDVTTSNL